MYIMYVLLIGFGISSFMANSMLFIIHASDRPWRKVKQKTGLVFPIVTASISLSRTVSSPVGLS